MPRETKHIEAFHRGLVLTIDSQDIPDDASPYQTNVDNQDPDGQLQGRKIDTTVTHPNHNTTSRGWIERSDGKRDLVFHDDSLGKLYVTTDFHGTPATTELLTTGVSGTSVAIGNRAAYVGLGKNVPPKFAGIVGVKTLLNPTADSIIAADADVSIPANVPMFAKTAVTPTYIYGIEFGANTLWRVKRSDGTIEKLGGFVSLRSICQDNVTTTRVWLYDSGASAYGTVYAVDDGTTPLALNTSLTTSLGSFSLMAGQWIADMEATTGLLWFSKYAPQEGADYSWTTKAQLLTIAKPTTAFSGATVVDRTPAYLTAGDAVLTNAAGRLAGGWYWKQTITGSTWYLSNPDVTAIVPTQRGLVRLNSTTVGWLQIAPWYANSNGDNKYGPYYFDGTTDRQIGTYLAVVAEASTRGRCGITYIDGAPSTYSFTDWTGLSVTSGVLYLSRYSSVGSWKLMYYTLGAFSATAGSCVAPGAITTKTPSGAEPVHSWVVTNSDGTYMFLARLDGNPGVDRISGTTKAIDQLYDGGTFQVVVTDGGSPGNLSGATSYYYKLAVEYDGYQVSPLTTARWKDPDLHSATNASNNHSVAITLLDKTKFSPRVTAILLFRAQGTFGDEPSMAYRQIVRIPLTSGEWTESGVQLTRTILDEDATGGVAYEAATGLPESIGVSMPLYQLSTTLNSELYVANCSHPEVEDDLSQVMFKSKAMRFSMFDWTKDYVRLPFKPTAIAGFAGRIYAFRETGFVVVNPNGMYVEDEAQGPGATDQNSVLVTEAGMFFCSALGIWQHTGKEIVPIGDVMLRGSLIDGWTQRSGSYRVEYSSRMSSVLFFHVAQDGTIQMLVYHVGKKRWDVWTTAQIGAYATFSDKNGEVYLTQGATVTKRIADASSRAAWYWYSKDFTMGEPSQAKKFYIARATVTGSVLVEYAKDGGASYATATGGAIASADRKCKSLRVRLSGTGSVQALGIVFRKMIGER